MPPGPQPRVWIVSSENAGERLDRFLCKRLPQLTRGSVRRLLEQTRDILVDGAKPARGTRLAKGQRVEVRGPIDERPIPQPDVDIVLVATTDTIVVVDKPAGMPSHPLTPGERNTVANALVARFPECAEASERPREGGFVHRLDRYTSGVMVAARDRAMYEQLRGHFTGGRVNKRYLALVAGDLGADGVVTLALRPMPGDRRRMCATPDDDATDAQPALTRYSPIVRLDEATLVTVACETGVRHQIRAHLAAIGHPLVGDGLYGGPALEGLEGAFLHASSIAWPGAHYRAELPQKRRVLLPKRVAGALAEHRGESDELGRL